jgi:hypothetical protein
MPVPSAIPPPYLLQVPLDGTRLNINNRGVLFMNERQEVAGRRHALASISEMVAFFLQVPLQSGKPLFVARKWI